MATLTGGAATLTDSAAVLANQRLRKDKNITPTRDNAQYSMSSSICSSPKVPETSNHASSSESHPSAKSGSCFSRHRRFLYKSPNILIYTGKKFSSALFTNLKEVILRCVGYGSYTVYHLKDESLLSTPWQDNCVLLVIAVEQIHDGKDKVFLKYFQEGGRILSCCSNFDKNICDVIEFDHPNSVQVMETEYNSNRAHLVRGRYFYSNTNSSTISSNTNSSNIANTNSDTNSNSNSKKSLLDNITFSTLVTSSRHGSNIPVVVEAVNRIQGVCILSQVHLEKSADQSAVDSDSLSLLTGSDALRHTMMKDVLERLGIGLEGDASDSTSLTLCSIDCVDGEEMLNKFIERVRQSHPSKIRDDILTISKVGEYNLSTQSNLACKPNDAFNWQKYKHSLTSRVLGRILIYQMVSNTTMAMVEPFQFCSPSSCGVAAVAGTQISGIGREGNTWLSPPGSLSITMLVKSDLNSTLGKTPSLIQTLPPVAVARTMHSHLQNYTGKGNADTIKVRVKWPNDIYYDKVKIGGVMVRSTILQNTLHCSVGVGVNVQNEKPTVNLNTVIADFNAANHTDVPEVSVEYMAARVCSEMELLIDMVNNDRREYMNTYYQYWLHSGKRVDVPDQHVQEGLVLGLDDFGFLKIQREDGSTFSVQPDGNSYDMMHNMIKVKEQF